jgi:hypothetical protein
MESPTTLEMPSWIEEFRRLPLSEKSDRYRNLSSPDRKLLLDLLVSPVLTNQRVYEAMAVRNVRSDFVKVLSARSIEVWKGKPASEVVKIIQILDDGPRSNWDEIGMPMDDVIKYFEYGVFGGYGYGIPSLPMSAVNAWLFGISWDEMLTPMNIEYIDNLTGVMDIEQWRLFASHVQWKFLGPKGMSALTYTNFQNLVEGKLIVQPFSIGNPDPSPNSTRDRDTRIRILLEEISKQGLIFDDPLPVYHFNHVQILDSYETYTPIHTAFIDIHGVHHPASDNNFRQSQLVQYLKWICVCSRFAYPRFRTRMWATYPKLLQQIIFSMLCISRLRSSSFSVGKDVMVNVILNYVVFNFYADAEEHLKNILTVRDQYARLRKPTLRIQAMDCGIVLPYGSVDADIRQVTYRLAISHFGYPRAVDNEEVFVTEAIKYAIDWKNIQKSLPDLANWRKKSHEVYRKSINTVSNLLRECYRHNVALSLLKSGDVKISNDGCIIDIERAIALSEAKRDVYFSQFIKMRDSKTTRPAKRLRSSRRAPIDEDDDLND